MIFPLPVTLFTGSVLLLGSQWKHLSVQGFNGKWSHMLGKPEESATIYPEASILLNALQAGNWAGMWGSQRGGRQVPALRVGSLAGGLHGKPGNTTSRKPFPTTAARHQPLF